MQQTDRDPRRKAMSNSTHQGCWWTISEEALLNMLRRAHQGEEPELIYTEEYANAAHEEGDQMLRPSDWWRCPNDPPCDHGAILHDINERDDPSPRCCVDGCDCGGSNPKKMRHD
jgi:hypothetical protein